MYYLAKKISFKIMFSFTKDSEIERYHTIRKAFVHPASGRHSWGALVSLLEEVGKRPPNQSALGLQEREFQGLFWLMHLQFLVPCRVSDHQSAPTGFKNHLNHNCVINMLSSPKQGHSHPMGYAKYFST